MVVVVVVLVAVVFGGRLWEGRPWMWDFLDKNKIEIFCDSVFIEGG